MSKQRATTLLAIVVSLFGVGTTVAQEAGFTQAVMWPSQSLAAANNFTAAILAKNPAGQLAFLSPHMPYMVSFGSAHTLGDAPYRISSAMVVNGSEKTFSIVFDTSDNTPFIGQNAYPGSGGGPTNALCFEVGNSLSGDMPIKVSDFPFDIVHTHAETYSDSGGLLLQLDNVPYVIKSGDTHVELNICFHHMDGTPVGPSRAARTELMFTVSTDVIFRDDFE